MTPAVLTDLMTAVGIEADRRNQEVVLAVLEHKPPRACEYITDLEQLARIFKIFDVVLDPETFQPIYTYSSTAQKQMAERVKAYRRRLAVMDRCGVCDGCRQVATGVNDMTFLEARVVSASEAIPVKKKSDTSGTTGTWDGGDRAGEWRSYDGDSDFEWPVGGNRYVPPAKPSRRMLDEFGW